MNAMYQNNAFYHFDFVWSKNDFVTLNMFCKDTSYCIPGRKSGILRTQYGHTAAAEISFWTR